MRLHRGRPAGVDRHRAGARRAPARRCPPRRHRLHGRALRRRAGRRPARGRPGRRVRRAARRPAGRAPPADPRAVPSTCPSSTCSTCRGPKATSPWAYVKIAEGCDRSCGFCAIPSFRGPQRSRSVASILAEVDELQAREIVLVAQDLASYGKDVPGELGAGAIVPLVRVGHRPRRSRAPAVPVPERSHRRARRRHLRHGRAVLRPVAAARQQAAAAADAPLGRRRALPAAHRGHPPPRARRRVPQQLHRRLPGRDRGRPRPPAALRRGRRARLVRVLRLQPRGRHVRRRPRRHGAGRA